MIRAIKHLWCRRWGYDFCKVEVLLHRGSVQIRVCWDCEYVELRRMRRKS